MGRPAITLLNKRFDSLVVIAYIGRNKFGNSKWLCRCDCGKEVEVFYQNLTRKNTKSCGCGIVAQSPSPAHATTPSSVFSAD